MRRHDVASTLIWRFSTSCACFDSFKLWLGTVDDYGQYGTDVRPVISQPNWSMHMYLGLYYSQVSIGIFVQNPKCRP